MQAAEILSQEVLMVGCGVEVCPQMRGVFASFDESPFGKLFSGVRHPFGATLTREEIEFRYGLRE